MATLLRAPVFAVSWLLVFGVFDAAPLEAAPQQPTSDPPVSLERIREELEKNPAPRLNLDVASQQSMATFRTGVDQRIWVPSLEEYLAKEFRLNVFQQQSAAWASKCCGLDLDQLVNAISKAWKRRELRKIREQIARELDQLEAARKKADLPDKQ